MMHVIDHSFIFVYIVREIGQFPLLFMVMHYHTVWIWNRPGFCIDRGVVQLTVCVMDHFHISFYILTLPFQ